MELIMSGNPNLSTIKSVTYFANKKYSTEGKKIDKVLFIDTKESLCDRNKKCVEPRRSEFVKNCLGRSVSIESKELEADKLHTFIPKVISEQLKLYSKNDIIVDLTNGKKDISSILYASASLSKIENLFFLSIPTSKLKEFPILESDTADEVSSKTNGVNDKQAELKGMEYIKESDTADEVSSKTNGVNDKQAELKGMEHIKESDTADEVSSKTNGVNDKQAELKGMEYIEEFKIIKSFLEGIYDEKFVSTYKPLEDLKDLEKYNHFEIVYYEENAEELIKKFEQFNLTNEFFKQTFESNIRSAIDNYFNENYPDSIRALGLIAEELTIEIYTKLIERTDLGIDLSNEDSKNSGKNSEYGKAIGSISKLCKHITIKIRNNEHLSDTEKELEPLKCLDHIIETTRVYRNDNSHSRRISNKNSNNKEVAKLVLDNTFYLLDLLGKSCILSEVNNISNCKE